MLHAMAVTSQEELRRAGLARTGTLPRLLALLRAAPEPHLSFRQVLRLVNEEKLGISPAELDRQLHLLVNRGLIVRLPSVAVEPIFDTVAEPHSHLVYEDTGQIVDLHVSADTLLAVLRQALARQSDRVEVLVRVRSIAANERDVASPVVKDRPPTSSRVDAAERSANVSRSFSVGPSGMKRDTPRTRRSRVQAGVPVGGPTVT